tara:strand:- start:10459 stop:11646 length:1188 start_codon:yes stop_codon:yes gene_type:complete
MSSSNEVQITYIEETVYGETPGAGNFKQARFTSDGLNAAPETSESAQIRTDRLSSGQVLTGLTVGGDLPIEFAKAQDIDDMLEAAMMNPWVVSAPVVEDIDVNTTAGTITRGANDWTVDVSVGDVIKLSGFVDPLNNVEVMVTSINNALVIEYVGPNTMVTEVGSGTSFQVNDKVEIGTTKKSFSFEKKFNDLTDKGLIYQGMYVDGFNLNATYGEIANGSFSYVGANYLTADQASELITDGRTIDPAPTSTSFNGSIDMSFLATSAGASFSGVDFCIQSIDITLANNSTAQNCVGKIGADNYSLGTAAVNITLSAYLSDEAWQFLDKKLSQESFTIGFTLKNGSGSYSFFLPAVQVAFDDPSSGGQNTDIVLDMSGVSKVGANGEKSLYIYKSF